MTLRLGELAVRFGCELRGDPDIEIHSVGTLEAATAGSISFLANPAYRKFLPDTSASAVIMTAEMAQDSVNPALLAADPYLVYARIATELHPQPAVRAGVHQAATVATTATVPASCEIAAGAIVGDDVVLGERVYVGPGCVVAAGASLGDDTRLYANVTIYHGVRIGARCLFHAGVVVGADGFGIAQSEAGWFKVPQLGSVVVGDDVELGANTTIDRGAIDDTVIGNGVKLDNLVQVAHNVRIGDHTAVAAQTGISGSAEVGAGCVIGGQSALAGHLKITDGVMLTGRSGVSKSITKPGVYSSAIAVEEAGKWRRINARIKRLDEMGKKLQRLEKELQRLQKDKEG